MVCFENGENIGRGSGRSIKGFDLHEALMNCTQYLEGFGGHSMAIGLSIKKENLLKLQKKMEIITDESNFQELKPTIIIEDTVNIDEVTKEMVQSLSLLEPIGEANKMPIFEFKNMKINSIRSLSDGKHLKLSLKTNKNTYIDAIGFNLGHFSEEFVIGDKIDIAGSLEINSFNGNDNIQINIKDLK